MRKATTDQKTRTAERPDGKQRAMTKARTGRTRKTWAWIDSDQKCCTGLASGPAAPYASCDHMSSQSSKYSAAAATSRRFCSRVHGGRTKTEIRTTNKRTTAAGGASRANIRPHRRVTAIGAPDRNARPSDKARRKPETTRNTSTPPDTHPFPKRWNRTTSVRAMPLSPSIPSMRRAEETPGADDCSLSDARVGVVMKSRSRRCTDRAHRRSRRP